MRNTQGFPPDPINTGNNQLYPQAVAEAKMWYKTKMPQSEL